MSVGVRERGTPQQRTCKRNSGEALKTKHLGGKKVQRVPWDKSHTGNAGNHQLHGKLFPSFASY